MGFFFNPPPVAGPIQFDSSFSEFFLCKVGEPEGIPLDDVREKLRRHDFIPAPAGSFNGVAIVVCDRVGPEALAKVESIRNSGADLVLVIAAGWRDPSVDPWRVLASGAEDLLVWSGLEESVDAVAARLGRWREVQKAVESLPRQGVVVGRSKVWRRTLAELVEAAKFSSAPVLITGETGTGKELMAHCVHALGPRSGEGELVLVDGSALNPELSGSELFGHEKGAFTGAVERREGALALADEGTLFLDEVGEMPAGLQSELLRALEDGAYKPVGGNQWKTSRFRLVCATNRDLADAVERGSFRRDLYFRLAGSVCRLPPLRDRREDVPALVEHFLKLRRPERPPKPDPIVREFLTNRDYPGNVRELKQVVGRLLSRWPGRGPLTVSAIPEQERETAERSAKFGRRELFEAAVRAALESGEGLEEIRKSVCRAAYEIVLAESEGDTARAAQRLKVTPRAVQMFLKSSVT